MNEPLLAFNIRDLMIFLLSKDQDIDATLRENEEVIGLQAESSHLRLPQLVTLVPVPNEFRFQVNHDNVECVNAY
jgi:hypothetical protein